MSKENRRLALIATKGALDMAYPPFILASTAMAMGFEVAIFFSFYGLQLLKKNLDHVRVSPLGNPALPMPMPVPTLLTALPGVEGLMTEMMKGTMQKKGIASLEELRALCVQGGVRLIACDMTMQMFDFQPSDFIDGVEIGGAATFLDYACDADIQLFV